MSVLQHLQESQRIALKSHISNAKINNKAQNLAKSNPTKLRIKRQDKNQESNYVKYACKHVTEQGVGNERQRPAHESLLAVLSLCNPLYEDFITQAQL